jgi:hypothetical protein
MTMTMAPCAMLVAISSLLDEVRALTSTDAVDAANCGSSACCFSKTESKCSDSSRSEQRFHVSLLEQAFGSVQASL